ncbi:MAG TPA: Gfo/Idh/MocA family oxidoreductase [Afifellaceae bacterium]|nr:Gfo/Idh/MocA family oxidoreductase [Afifellaceae bacterium]
MSQEPVRVASIGMGWWSDVLADAASRSDRIEIVACYTRSPDKRRAFAEKYGCRAAETFEDILTDDAIEAVLNTTPNNAHLETTRAAAEAGKHVFLDKPIANSVAEGLEITRVCREAGVVLAVGYQRRRESHFRWIKREIEASRFGRPVQAEGNISRDRLGKIDLSSWRYQAAGMPGGVMLQIGIHYTDVLEMLLGPVRRVSGASARLVLPGDNPDVANLILEHESGAISNLTASYASASEFYMMNVYGKEASAYYDLFGGLRHLTRNGEGPVPVPCEKVDTIREELEEFAESVRGRADPEMDGERATRSLATIRAGVKAAREGRAVEVEEVMSSGE